jgi:rare lipoprotein A
LVIQWVGERALLVDTPLFNHLLTSSYNQRRTKNDPFMKQLLMICLSLMCYGLSLSGALAQDVEYGMASHYSDDFDGRPTAYGDIYNKNEMTCAHKIHPYGAMLRVTRMDNGRSVTVKVIDKGPYITGRVVDLSRRAAERLGIMDADADVKVEVVSKPGRESSVASNSSRSSATTSGGAAAAPTPRPASYEASEAAPKAAAAEPAAAESVAPTARGVASSPAKAPTTATTTTQAATDRRNLVGKDFNAGDGLYKIAIEKPGKGDFGVQVGRYNSYDNALRQIAELQAQSFSNILLSMQPGENNQTIFRVILGPFPTEAAAQSYDQSLRRRYRINGFVVGLAELR